MRHQHRHQVSNEKAHASTSWDSVATWYDGWVGEDGSEHHREVAIPALLDLLEPADVGVLGLADARLHFAAGVEGHRQTTRHGGSVPAHDR